MSPPTSLTIAHSLSLSLSFSLLILVLLHHPAQTAAHGLMNYPNPRGGLNAKKSRYIFHSVNESKSVTTDFWMHFPAGDKTPRPGAGLRSQIAAVSPRPWTPFEPLRPTFPWRAGVCGDTLDGKAHLRGGKYYNDGQIVKTYREGGTVDVGLTIVAHHNGFIELHVCDVAKCRGGEISRSCFREGHCKQLQRRRTSECEGGMSTKCGPIDRNYPGRWYLPCRKRGPYHTFGGDGTISYRLPENMTCEHCVLQWFWTAANTCNPPGVVDYFQGPDKPRKWGKCRGQAGAIGGYTNVQQPCGKRFPEEYLQCADIRILPKSSSGGGSGGSGVTVTPTPTASQSQVLVVVPTVDVTATPEPLEPAGIPPSMAPTGDAADEEVSTTPSAPMATMVVSPSASVAPSVSPSASASVSPAPAVSAAGSVAGSKPDDDEESVWPSYDPTANQRQRYGGVQDVVLIGDGKRIVSLHSQRKMNVSSFARVSIEAVTSADVKEVAFFVRGREFVDRRAPFYMFGDDGRGGVRYRGEELIVGQKMNVVVSANGDNDRVRIFLYR